MKSDSRQTENISELLNGLKDILSTNQASFLKLLEESDKRAEKRQEEADKRHEESDKRHEKQKAEIDSTLQTLIKSTTKLMISHTESKKDKEVQSRDSMETKADLKELWKSHRAMNDVVKITAERQSVNSGSIGKGKDHFHKIVTGLISAALIYLVTTKGG